jgi:hypothetical protein
MNDQNSLENQLRGWIPRRPSASVKTRLFSDPARDSGRPWLTARNWLTPAAASLLVLVLASARLRESASTPGNGLPMQMIAAALSNQSSAAYCVEPANIALNAPIFRLPKASRLTSSLGSFEVLRTNSLLQ